MLCLNFEKKITIDTSKSPFFRTLDKHGENSRTDRFIDIIGM